MSSNRLLSPSSHSSIECFPVALLLIVGACASVIKPGRLIVTPEPAGFVQLASGAAHVRVDLRGDVPGCLGERYDPTTGERSGSDAALEVLDISNRAGRSYILLSAVAPPNCNVQGMCGAAPQPNVSLIWLKVTSEMTVEDKQTVVVEDCRTDRSVEGLPDDWAEHLRTGDGKLRITFRQSGPAGQDVTGTAEYDRRSPEAGIRLGGPR